MENDPVIINVSLRAVPHVLRVFFGSKQVPDKTKKNHLLMYFTLFTICLFCPSLMDNNYNVTQLLILFFFDISYSFQRVKWSVYRKRWFVARHPNVDQGQYE